LAAKRAAEKKARERGLSGASETTPPTVSPAATGQYVSPSYTGRSGGSQAEEEPSSGGGVSALRNRFAGQVPMGAPTSPQRTGGFSGDREPPSPPPVDTDSRPSIATGGAVKMPGFPPRPTEDEEVTPAGIPPPPAQPRSPSPPTPEMPGSPIRIARPIARDEPEEDLVTKVEPLPTIPAASLDKVIPHEEDLPEEEPSRERTQQAGGGAGGRRATVLYDYEAAEDNEISLVEGQVVTDIDMVDDDWWAGRNSGGETGLFPSNYVELMEGEAEEAHHEEPAAPSIPAGRPVPEPEPHHEPEPEPEPEAHGGTGHKAVAIYDYEAAEENELSFPEGAIIENIEFPDDDWWAGHYKGKEGLFPANYVELQQH